MPRWLRPYTIAAVLLFPPLRAAGQIAATCGWSFMDPHDVPPTLQILRNRAQ